MVPAGCRQGNRGGMSGVWPRLVGPERPGAWQQPPPTRASSLPAPFVQSVTARPMPPWVLLKTTGSRAWERLRMSPTAVPRAVPAFCPPPCVCCAAGGDAWVWSSPGKDASLSSSSSS